MTTLTLDIRQVTAEHEAAHATAYLALGYPIHRVEIEPEGFTLSTPRPALRPLRDVAVITAAGLVVESRHGTIPMREQLEETVTLVDEGWNPSDLGDLGFFAEHPYLLTSALREAEALLETYNAYHQRVTETLLARGFLTSKTIPAFTR